MRVTHGPTMGGAWVLTAVLVTTACSTPASHPRSPGLEHQLQELALVAERDSLQLEVAATGKLLTDIEGELSHALPVPPATGVAESPVLEITKDRRTFTLDRVREVAARLRSTEARLATSERRVRKLTQSVDTLTEGLAATRITAAQLAEEVGSQRLTIDGLTAQVETLLSANLDLADSVYHLTERRNTAYYVVGSRKELIQRGILKAAEGRGHTALAIDRTDDTVSHLYDPLHPAVLNLVAHIIRACNKAGKPIALCGEMAGDVQLTRLLLGLGLRQLSMHPAYLLEVKQQVLKSKLHDIAPLAARILRAEDPDRVRAMLARLNA